MSGYGPCWCCANHGLEEAAVSTLRLCRPCGSRSPSACKNAHESHTPIKELRFDPGPECEKLMTNE